MHLNLLVVQKVLGTQEEIHQTVLLLQEELGLELLIIKTNMAVPVAVPAIMAAEVVVPEHLHLLLEVEEVVHHMLVQHLVHQQHLPPAIHLLQEMDL